jgi:hypothetical protein
MRTRYQKQDIQGGYFPLRTPESKSKHIVPYLVNNTYIILQYLNY